jgi:hypothetical protein
VKLLRPKDDPGTEKFLEYFYKKCIELLFKSFSDIPEFKNQTGQCSFQVDGMQLTRCTCRAGAEAFARED